MNTEWKVVWESNKFLRMTTEACSFQGTDGIDKTYHRFSVADGITGGVALVLKENKFALVKQYRPAINRELWEFPRGVGEVDDADGVGAPAREAREELGLAIKNPRYLGRIYPDSGVLANGVDVALIEAGEKLDDGDGEVEDVCWVNPEELEDMIRRREICDGITLSAYALWKVQR